MSREAFEKHFINKWRVAKPEHAGSAYYSDSFECAWQGWQAAMESKEQLI